MAARKYTLHFQDKSALLNVLSEHLCCFTIKCNLLLHANAFGVAHPMGHTSLISVRLVYTISFNEPLSNCSQALIERAFIVRDTFASEIVITPSTIHVFRSLLPKCTQY